MKNPHHNIFLLSASPTLSRHHRHQYPGNIKVTANHRRFVMQSIARPWNIKSKGHISRIDYLSHKGQANIIRKLENEIAAGRQAKKLGRRGVKRRNRRKWKKRSREVWWREKGRGGCYRGEVRLMEEDVTMRKFFWFMYLMMLVFLLCAKIESRSRHPPPISSFQLHRWFFSLLEKCRFLDWVTGTVLIT